MTINDRIQKLRSLMSNRNVDVYIIVTGDFHQSEYTGEYFNSREFMSGFTGSAGTLIISKEEAVLFTDGRYFIQAENQLKGTKIKLMKTGMPGVPDITEYISLLAPPNGCIGFDGRVVDALWGRELENVLSSSNCSIKYDEDLVGYIWENRPNLSDKPVYILEDEYAGEPVKDKLIRLRASMNKYNAQVHVIATLDDICWLFNIRGNDVKYNPVVLAFAVITQQEAILFANKEKFSQTIVDKLLKYSVRIEAYENIYKSISEIKNTRVLVDTKRINYSLLNSFDKSVCVIEEQNPTVLMKAIKNRIEIKNLKEIHIQDGVAVTKFIYWLKSNISSKKITEIDAADYLEQCRRKIPGFIELSFDTISAYGANAAMMHYSATKESDEVLRPKGMLLVDSGGQYYKGTTDVTRTLALGEVTEDMKKHFTLTLKGMLNLANAKFLYGCDGFNLDILARQPLWNIGVDYRCGTGHGVGYLLNVHEAPNGFRWKRIFGKDNSCILEEGMVTSDEPGVYIEGRYGIRIENEIVCKKSLQNEYGQFMEFDMLTMVPIDLELVDKKYLNNEDVNMLNRYHRDVYNNLESYFEGEQKDWLKMCTRQI